MDVTCAAINVVSAAINVTSAEKYAAGAVIDLSFSRRTTMNVHVASTAISMDVAVQSVAMLQWELSPRRRSCKRRRKDCKKFGCRVARDPGMVLHSKAVASASSRRRWCCD
jgi:hypothetical protein